MRCSKPFFAAALVATLAACADEPTGPSDIRTIEPGAPPTWAMHADSSRVVAYFPSWYSGSLDKFPWSKVTHVLYAFLDPTSTGGLTGIAMSGDTELQGIVTRAHNAGAKVLISVGGWSGGNDSNWVSMAASSTYRATFVNNLVTFCDNYGLDGVDMDWEYPDTGSQAANFALLMDELNTAMDADGRLLTAAVAASGSNADGISSSVFNEVDFLTLMAYARGTPPHSPYAYAVESLDYWSMRGLPKSKTVLGVPFYGKNSSGQNLPYRELVRLYSPAANAGSAGGYYFTGLDTMELKTTLSLQRGSGVGIWEWSNDTTATGLSLLDAIHDAMNSPVPPYNYLTVVYDDMLQGWADWSWNATRSFTNGSPAWQGTQSISLQITAAWGGLQLYYNAGVDPTKVDTLEFYIHGGGTGGRNLLVYVKDAAGTSSTKVSVASRTAGGSVAANEWRRVAVPLTAFNIGTTMIHRVVISDNSGAPQSTFYIDYMRFRK